MICNIKCWLSISNISLALSQFNFIDIVSSSRCCLRMYLLHYIHGLGWKGGIYVDCSFFLSSCKRAWLRSNAIRHNFIRFIQRRTISLMRYKKETTHIKYLFRYIQKHLLYYSHGRNKTSWLTQSDEEDHFSLYTFYFCTQNTITSQYQYDIISSLTKCLFQIKVAISRKEIDLICSKVHKLNVCKSWCCWLLWISNSGLFAVKLRWSKC